MINDRCNFCIISVTRGYPVGVSEYLPLYFEVYGKPTGNNLNFEIKIRCVYDPTTNSYFAVPEKKKKSRWSSEMDSIPEGGYEWYYNKPLSTEFQDYQSSDYYWGNERLFGGILSGFGHALGNLFNGVGKVASNIMSGAGVGNSNICNAGLIQKFGH